MQGWHTVPGPAGCCAKISRVRAAGLLLFSQTERELIERRRGDTTSWAWRAHQLRAQAVSR